MDYIYKFLNKNNEVIYVGITGNVSMRSTKQHFTSNGHLDKKCYEETQRIFYSECINIDDSKIKERYLINKLMPKYNEKMKNDSKFKFEIDDFNWKQININNRSYLRDIKTESKRKIKYLSKSKNTNYSKKYTITALEQKLIFILASTINKDETSNIKTFKVIDLAELMDVTPELLYIELPKITRKIMNRKLEIENNDISWEIINIISYAKYEKRKGCITVEYSYGIKPYLIKLKEICDSFEIKSILKLSSKYSIKLYELLKINNKNNKYQISVNDFGNTMKLSERSYSHFSNINLKVLKPAISEINTKTDINVKLKLKKVGRKVEELEFIIK